MNLVFETHAFRSPKSRRDLIGQSVRLCVRPKSVIEWHSVVILKLYDKSI
jgi:hypothetical protein